MGISVTSAYAYADDGSSGSSSSFSYNLAAGTTKLIALCTPCASTHSLSFSASWNGVSMTRAASSNYDYGYALVFYLDNPATGTKTFTMWPNSGTCFGRMGLIGIDGAKTGSYSSATSVTNSIGVSSTALGWVFGASYKYTSSVSVSSGASALSAGSYAYNHYGLTIYSSNTSAGTKTITYSTSTTVRHSVASFEAKPSGGNRIFGGVFIERAKEIMRRPILEQFPLAEPEHPLGWNKKGGLLVPRGA